MTYLVYDYGSCKGFRLHRWRGSITDVKRESKKPETFTCYSTFFKVNPRGQILCHPTLCALKLHQWKL